MLEAARLRASNGMPTFVHVSGPAGIGKTALLSQFLREHCAGDIVLRATGDEIEHTVPFAILDQLAASAPASYRSLTETVATATTDVLSAGSWLLQVVSELCLEGTVVLAIDDAQWCDSATLQAAAFAARRLHNDPVLLVVCTRDDTSSPAPVLMRILATSDVRRVALSGLSLAELAEFAEVGDEGSLPPILLARVHAHTEGNPLYARALLTELGRRPPDAMPGFPLPAPAAYATGIGERMASCHERTQRFVRASSVLGTGATLELAARLADIDDAATALDEAVAADLLQAPDNGAAGLAFAHPLTRSAVYYQIPLSERAALHRKAADLVAERSASINHRIVAATGHDDALAREAYELAAEHLARGAADLAYETFRAASRLTADTDYREQCFVEALESLLAIGDIDAATTFLEATARFDNAARRAYTEGCVALIQGRRYEAAELLGAVWDEPDAPPTLRGRAAVQLATYSVNQGRGNDVIMWAERASSLPPEATPPWALHAGARLIGLVQAGRIDEALAESDELERSAGAEPRLLDALAGRGVIRKWADRLSDARADLGFVYEATRRDGPLSLSLLALVHLTETEYRAGAWDAAIAHGALAVSIIADTNQLWLQGLAHGYAAMPLAGRGLFDDAAVSVSITRRNAVTLDDVAFQTFACTADALLAHARNDPEGVARAAQPLLDMDYVDGLDEPGVSPWRSLLTEALVRLGRLDEAAVVIEPLEQRARERNRESALLSAARARGALEHARNQRDAADEAFDSGADLALRIPQPFEVGLFHLVHGAYLRRTRRRNRAAEVLRAARTQLQMLGARPYLESCDRELAAATGTPTPSTGATTEALTPQELAVAHLVTAGLTNREIAAELVVSVKTVEYHLSKTYTKLGVRTRTQLIQHLAMRSEHASSQN
jgi:DNA-binding CsgD family transcriptional regulator